MCFRRSESNLYQVRATHGRITSSSGWTIVTLIWWLPGTRMMRAEDTESISEGAPERWQDIVDAGPQLLLMRGTPRPEENTPDCLASGGTPEQCGANPNKRLLTTRWKVLSCLKGPQILISTNIFVPKCTPTEARGAHR